MNFLENEFFLLAITFGIFFLAKLLQKKTGIMLLNPILLTIALLIIFLKMTNISYDTYNKGGHLIEFWLKPAVVALGVPLYLQLETIKKQLLPILLSQLAGCIAGVISVVPDSYTHVRAHETKATLVCRLLLEKKKNKKKNLSFPHKKRN